MDKYLRNLQRNWDDLGSQDPLWAILTEKEKRKGQWDAEEFFQTGKRKVENVLDEIRGVDFPVGSGRALDFGCGVGRLTQALCQVFDEVHGIDISVSMIAHAQEFNYWPKKCFYRVNEDEKIEEFHRNYFDFICAIIVLQHLKPRYAKEYLKEFLRILKLGGIIVFQLPSEPTSRKAWLHSVTPSWIWSVYTRIRYGHWGVMEMNGILQKEVVRLLEENGGKVIQIRQDDLLDWSSYFYYVTKSECLQQISTSSGDSG